MLIKSDIRLFAFSNDRNEFVSCKSDDSSYGSENFAQDPCKGYKCLVTFFMGIVVIYLLESVKVEHVGNDRFLALLITLKFPVQLEPVIDASELVNIDALVLECNDYARKRDRKACRQERDAVHEGLADHAEKDWHKELDDRKITESGIPYFRDDVINKTIDVKNYAGHNEEHEKFASPVLIVHIDLEYDRREKVDYKKHDLDKACDPEHDELAVRSPAVDMLDYHVNKEDAYQCVVQIQIGVANKEHHAVEPETRTELAVIKSYELVNDAVYNRHYEHAQKDMALLFTAGQIPAP